MQYDKVVEITYRKRGLNRTKTPTQKAAVKEKKLPLNKCARAEPKVRYREKYAQG
jgi:hypothetical protein